MNNNYKQKPSPSSITKTQRDTNSYTDTATNKESHHELIKFNCHFIIFTSRRNVLQNVPTRHNNTTLTRQILLRTTRTNCPSIKKPNQRLKRLKRVAENLERNGKTATPTNWQCCLLLRSHCL